MRNTQNLNGRLRRVEKIVNTKEFRQKMVLMKLEAAIRDGRVTIDQAAARWPNIARDYLQWKG